MVTELCTLQTSHLPDATLVVGRDEGGTVGELRAIDDTHTASRAGTLLQQVLGTLRIQSHPAGKHRITEAQSAGFHSLHV